MSFSPTPSPIVRLLRFVWAVLRAVLTPIRLPWNAWAHWLHTRWPAGTVEKLPEVNADGTTNVPGLLVVGDLTGVPLLKFSADSGARAVQTIAAEKRFQKERGDADVLDLVIVGAGVSGMAAALEAKKLGLSFVVLEGATPFATIENFPKGKPIYTYPSDMTPSGDMQFAATVKEELLEELHAQTDGSGIAPRTAMVEKILRRGHCLEAVIRDADSVLARRVIVAIGRSGNFRKLGVPGEDRDKVSNRLHDPKDFCGKQVLVVGGGDSAVETAIALAECGSHVDLSYRKSALARPKPENVAALERLQRDPMAKVPDTNPETDRITTPAGSYLDAHRQPGRIDLHLGSTVQSIDADTVTLRTPAGETRLANDAVLTMIGREAPLDFFRRSGVRIRGETRGFEWAPLTLFFLFIWFVYSWKNGSPVGDDLAPHVFGSSWPGNMFAQMQAWFGAQVADRSTWLGTLAVSMQSRSFYYTLLYTLCIGWFGLRRILRRRTPYVTAQTSVLFFVQLFPLFLLPELILPWLGYNGHLPLGGFADALFPLYEGQEAAYAAGSGPDWGHPREYWRAYGFILAFPLSIYNVLTIEPHAAWLWICAAQTFVIIPLLVWKWGKGSFCGWICSCGGLAETMGDAHRHKMFHGPAANRWNMLGQAVLIAALALLALRLWTWWFADGVLATWLDSLYLKQRDKEFAEFAVLNEAYPFGYKWVVDVLLGGVLGVGLYFKYSGRLWCRFACPLAALMHVYARFTRFRIFADKKKCISCNVCTTNCHMGIDVMNFANKGLPMEDPECVRCSACVQTCPTGVLQFGEIGRDGSARKLDSLTASRVVRAERSAVPPPDSAESTGS